MLLLSAAALAETPFARPMVSITFDDGFQSQFDLARPALNQRGLKATYYLTSQPIQQSWSNYLTVAEAKTIAAEGNEIAGHTVTHPHLPLLSAAQLDQELADSKSWLQSNLAATVASFASPYGEFNDAVMSRVKASFGSHRRQGGGRVFSESDPYLLRSVYVRSTTAVAEMQSFIDQTIVEGGWLILTFHDLTTGTPSCERQYPAASFAAVLDYLNARGLAVVTIAQGLAQLGAAWDGDPKKWIYGDWFGTDVEDWSWAKIDFAQTAVVHDGRTAISFKPDNWGGLAFHLNGGFDPAVWTRVELWLHGGATGGQRVQLSFHNGSAKLGAVSVDTLLGRPIAANTWQKVAVQLSQLGIASGSVGEIYLEDTSGAVQPEVYVDSVVLKKPPPYVIYDDALRGGFQDWSWAVHNLAQSAPVHSGTASSSFVPNNWDALYFHHDGLDTSLFRSIEMFVNGGSAGGQDIMVALWDGNLRLGQIDVPQLLGHPLRPNFWERVLVPLSAIGATGRPLRDLYIQDASGLKQPAVYLDDIRLVP
jgi:peptidoglycan/xylan/chitin deacetylase (PgdA/CDA1 family)